MSLLQIPTISYSYISNLEMYHHTFDFVNNKKTYVVVNFQSVMVPGFVLSLPPRDGFENNPSDHET
jgi:hypothetical protein